MHRKADVGYCKKTYLVPAMHDEDSDPLHSVLIDLLKLDGEPVDEAMSVEEAMQRLDIPDCPETRAVLRRVELPQNYFWCQRMDLVAVLHDAEAVSKLAWYELPVTDATLAALRYTELRLRMSRRFLQEFSERHDDDDVETGPRVAVIVDAALSADAIVAGVFSSYEDFEGIIPVAEDWLRSERNVFAQPLYPLPTRWRWILSGRDYVALQSENHPTRECCLWCEQSRLSAGELFYAMDPSGQPWRLEKSS